MAYALRVSSTQTFRLQARLKVQLTVSHRVSCGCNNSNEGPVFGRIWSLVVRSRARGNMCGCGCFKISVLAASSTENANVVPRSGLQLAAYVATTCLQTEAEHAA